ncbi:hypothetical protein [Oceanobacillus senegalensis]|uniref:hypothetical protein n=1 Tax=Oceanobacillus senegalensis TaxID=1936063 RepID=UPI000A313A47|nr:hypothetical protein [Oceanobacillus senegalensis]
MVEGKKNTEVLLDHPKDAQERIAFLEAENAYVKKVVSVTKGGDSFTGPFPLLSGGGGLYPKSLFSAYLMCTLAI